MFQLDSILIVMLTEAQIISISGVPSQVSVQQYIKCSKTVTTRVLCQNIPRMWNLYKLRNPKVGKGGLWKLHSPPRTEFEMLLRVVPYGLCFIRFFLVSTLRRPLAKRPNTHMWSFVVWDLYFKHLTMLVTTNAQCLGSLNSCYQYHVSNFLN